MPAKKTSSTDSGSSFRLYRSEKNKVLGGVCGGLGEMFDIDPSIVRLIFILMFVFGGSGLLIYLLLWLIIPSEGQGSASHETVKKGVDEMRGRAHEFAEKFRSREKGGNRSFVGWVLLLLGILFLTNSLGIASHFDFFFPFIFIIVGLFMIYQAKK